MFTILVGSYARGTATKYSDIDIVRIGHHRKVAFSFPIPQGTHVSHIDYSKKTFTSLHNSGSLFLKHIFLEGILLDGPKIEWDSFAKTFVPAKSFETEIESYADVLRFLTSNIDHTRAHTAFLFHVFRCLKNIAIFTLAQNHIYIFDKRKSLQKAFPNFSTSLLKSLLLAESVFERGQIEKPHPCLNVSTAMQAFTFSKKLLEQ